MTSNPSTDAWLRMLNAAVEDADSIMRWRSARHLEAKKRMEEGGVTDWVSPEYVAACELEAKRMEAIFNIVSALKFQYEGEKAKGKVWPSTERMILAGMSAYEQKKRAS